MMTYELDLS